MAEAVLSVALERIEYLLINEYKLLSGVEDNVYDLRADLQLMRDFLIDVDKRQVESELVRRCISEIKNLAFRTENVLEDFAFQVASNREREGFRRFVGKIYECIPRHRYASEIVNIQNDITKRIKRLKGFNIILGQSSSTPRQRELLLRRILPHQIEKDFVGMVDDQEKLKSHLKSYLDKNDAVITIKGMGGRGKTTMANRLYNLKDVRDQFTNFAWVCVTQTFQPKNIWQEILKQLCPEKEKKEVTDMGDDELVQTLKNIQLEKKCLVVLDDIWSMHDWQSLKPGFPVEDTDNVGGSKLLLTTRKLDAKVGYVHVLGSLNDEEGWQLLKKKAFPGNEEKHGIPRHRYASEIVNIQNDITKRIKRLKGFNIILGQSSSTPRQRELLLRRILPHQIEKDFVGMVDDQEKLKSHLKSYMDKNDAVITIKGMGGRGKTTMANRLYNLKDVRDQFTNFAWVCVTQTFQPKNIWQEILKQLCPEKEKKEVTDMGDDELVQTLKNIQLEKKCLVVLDDIWSMHDWQSLKPGFPVEDTDNVGGSKLLLTTRKLDAKVGYVHVLGSLNDEEGWQLLKKKAFPGNEEKHELQIKLEIEKIGRDIVKKCERLPLAISVLGGILKDKTTLEEWEMLSRNISKYLRKGEGIEEDQDSVINVLGLSYNELPYLLKPCFLYLAAFPEDSEISIEELCLLWIGEGFVYSSHRGEGETMMDVARKYLNELAQRSMVTLVSNRMGENERCRLHDLMREMCISQGKKDEFFTVIDHQVSEQNPRLVFSPNSCSRRLALSFDRFQSVEIPIKQHDTVSCIGSLILRGPIYIGSRITVKAPGIKKFRFLRALQVEGHLRIQYEDLERISKLIHLRLLIFKGCYISRVPSCISTLPYLETLGLEVENVSVIIPNTLGRMKQLRHLFLPSWYKVEGGEKLRLDGLVNVELLSGVKTTRCRVEDFGKLNRLHTLRVEFKDDGTDEEMRCLIENMNIASRFHLRNTTLGIYGNIFSSEDSISLLQDLFHCLALQELRIDGLINKLPEPNHYHQFTSSLTKINLWDSELKEDPMKTLEKLPNLQTLVLLDWSFVGEEMACSKEGFPQLKTLLLRDLYKLKKWEVEDGAMPKLHYLEIDECNELEMVPYGLKFLKALKQLEIVGMRHIAKRVGVEGEDFEKVKHVPSITYRKFR